MTVQENKLKIQEALHQLQLFLDLYEGLAQTAKTDRHIEVIAKLGTLAISKIKDPEMTAAVISFSQELAKESTQ